jgi:tetratricopeptide (TPR) repeat protein
MTERYRYALALAIAGLLSAVVPRPAAARPQNPEWVEVRSPNFHIVSDAPEAKAQQLARDFEQVRQVYMRAVPGLENRAGLPLLVLAAKNEKTLKSLLPEYWEGHRARPLGVYVGGPERNFVALRLDAPGRHPYHIVYHEYFHFLMRLNYPVLPLWLSEGLAEFWSYVTVSADKVTLGQPSREHLDLLRHHGLLPLEVLFQVGQSSPLYNDEDKAGLFYAQSWLLVHYLMLGEGEHAGRERIDRLLELLRTEESLAEVHRRIFPRPEQLLRELSDYLRSDFRQELSVPAPEGMADVQFPSRRLALAEAIALRANFHAHTNRPAEARALVEQALRLDPYQPLAHEAMGYLYYMRGESEEAIDWFARAAELDSESCLAHYYLGLTEAQSPLRGEDRYDRAERALRRAMALNPNFAAAYHALAVLLLDEFRNLEEALRLAQRAAALEPGALGYQVTLGKLLLASGRPDEARRVARHLNAAARNERERQQAQELDAAIASYAAMLARQQQAMQLAAEGRRGAQQIEKNAAGQEEKAKDSQAANQTPEEHRKRPEWKGRRVKAEGTITELSCEGRKMWLKLDFGGLFVRLQASSYEDVEYLATRWQPPPNFLPCEHLKDRKAEITYVVVQERPFVGEIVSIEVRP